MATRILIEGLPVGMGSQSIWRHLLRRTCPYLYSTAQKATLAAQENFENMQKPLDFKAFKREKLKSMEEFAKSPRIQALFGDDRDKIKKAYEDYCVCKFNRYQLAQHGGNPGSLL